jgi:hypothetical protein
MEAINDSLKLIAQAIEVLKALDHEEDGEVISLLRQAIDKLAI